MRCTSCLLLGFWVCVSKTVSFVEIWRDRRDREEREKEGEREQEGGEVGAGGENTGFSKGKKSAQIVLVAIHSSSNLYFPSFMASD